MHSWLCRGLSKQCEQSALSGMALLQRRRGICLPGRPDCSWAWRKMSCKGSWSLLVSASFCQASASLRCKIHTTLPEKPRSNAPGSDTQQRGEGETCDAVFAVSFPCFSQMRRDVVCNNHEQTTCLTLWLVPELESKCGKCYWLCLCKERSRMGFCWRSQSCTACWEAESYEWVTARLRLGCVLKERSLHKMKWFNGILGAADWCKRSTRSRKQRWIRLQCNKGCESCPFPLPLQ